MVRKEYNFQGGRIIALAFAFTCLLLINAICAPGFAQSGYDPTARGGGFNPLAPSTSGRPSSEEPAPKYDPSDEYLGLPKTEGVDTVFTQCTPCHSAATFMQQRLSRPRWDKLVDWMVETQGMLEPEQEDREVILDYLTRHFGSTQ